MEAAVAELAKLAANEVAKDFAKEEGEGEGEGPAGDGAAALGVDDSLLHGSNGLAHFNGGRGAIGAAQFHVAPSEGGGGAGSGVPAEAPGAAAARALLQAGARTAALLTPAQGARGAAQVLQHEQPQVSSSSSSAPAAEAGAEAASQPWWAPVAGLLPKQGSPKQEERRQESLDEDDATRAVLQGEAFAGAQKPFWAGMLDNNFMRSLPGMPGKRPEGEEAAAKEQEQAAADGEQPPAGEEGAKQPWWAGLAALLPRRVPSGGDADPASAGTADDGSPQPVESIVIPPDLLLEDIAKEVARMKEDQWRSKEDHMQNLWAQTVERNDRSWITLLCFLVAIAIGLLSIVAYRLDHLPLMLMLLMQHYGGGGAP